MIVVTSARDLILGGVDATLDAWRLARDNGRGAHVEAFDLLALLGHLERFRKDRDVAGALERIRAVAQADRDRLAKAAFAGIDPDGWLEDARWLEGQLDQEDPEAPDRLVSAARTLFRQLDDAELVLTSARALGAFVPTGLSEGVASCVSFLETELELFLDAVPVARSFREQFVPGLDAHDPDLWGTTLKHELLANLLEQPRASVAPSAAARPRRKPNRLLEPALAAAPAAPGTGLVAHFRWKAADGSWRAQLDVPRRPSKDAAVLLTLRFLLADGTAASQLDGSTVRLCGLELDVEKAQATVPLGLLRPAWESWAKDRPDLRVRAPNGDFVVGDLSEPDTAK